MPLAAGTVSVHPTTGAVSGSGYARDLYDAEGEQTPPLVGDLADAIAALPAAFVLTFGPKLLELRINTAAKCNSQAAAMVALIQTGTVVVPGGGAGGTFPVV